MLHRSVFNTSEICRAHGVNHAVLSPGSRNAPLTISFARNENIKKWVIPDERAAGFIALGIAQQLDQPVVLCCTSGTALLNYAPAIAEAFYREIPLIVLSADRPPELIDQRDGQTIRQFEVLKNHVKGSYQLPIVTNDETGESYLQELKKALPSPRALPKGPIHINIPFKEPFYPEANQLLSFDPVEPIQSDEPYIHKPAAELESDIVKGKKVLMVIGQQVANEQLSAALKELESSIPILKSPLNNLDIEGIQHVDFFLDNQPELQPDILITSGLSVLSKKLKNFIRRFAPKKHFHIDPAGVPIDTYNSAPELLQVDLINFLKVNDLSKFNESYLTKWKQLERQTTQALSSYIFNDQLSETQAAKILLASVPEGAHLHLSNSMPVRFADLFGVPGGITTWSNRGTSGIDGCTSTALGTALVSDALNVLITGELAFLYDRNAFFHNHQPPNLRVIVINNQGGGIFRLIDGPSRLPELETYFEAKHNQTARYICEEYGIAYHALSTKEELASALKDFYTPSGQPKLLEVFTDPELNEHVFKDLKKYINEHINN